MTSRAVLDWLDQYARSYRKGRRGHVVEVSSPYLQASGETLEKAVEAASRDLEALLALEREP